MLQHLSIQNFTIIRQLDLEFKSGMTVLTGETGAGKSILVDALLLTLGDRADSKMIQHGCDRCTVNASFNIADLPAAQAWLTQHELSQDGECYLRRTVTTDGRSKGFINGQPVPIQSLRELGSFLISIHGQHEHQALLKSEHQRILFDAYANHPALVKTVHELFSEWRNAQDEFLALQKLAQQSAARLELLQYQVTELDQLSLSPTELEELTQEHRQLTHAEELLAGAQQAQALLNDSDHSSVLHLLTKAHSALNNKKIIDTKLDAAADLLNSAMIQIAEACSELDHYCDRIELNPARLLEVEQRLTQIHDLARKHRVTPENLSILHQQLQQELTQIVNSDTQLQQLQLTINKLADDYLTAAKKLSASRQKAAKKLAPAIEQQIQQLGMPGGRFAVQLEAHLQMQNYSPHGLEKPEFFVSANPGMPLQPLAKVASGGELSRISLAIHVLTAQNDATPTLIFDEVDVGIGGGTAEIVGRLLRTLGDSAQVLCVTHLPQVAALSHHHFQVGKTIEADSTQTAVTTLDKKTKIQEIARMLGGVKVTDQTLAHAREMVEMA